MSDFLHIAADTLPIWRDAAIVVLFGIIIGCVWLVAGMYGGE